MPSFLKSLSNLNEIDFKVLRDQPIMLEIFVIGAGIGALKSRHAFEICSSLFFHTEFLYVI